MSFMILVMLVAFTSIAVRNPLLYVKWNSNRREWYCNRATVLHL